MGYDLIRIALYDQVHFVRGPFLEQGIIVLTKITELMHVGVTTCANACTHIRVWWKLVELNRLERDVA